VRNIVEGEIQGDRIFFTATSSTTVTFTYVFESNPIGGPYLTHTGSRLMYQANLGGNIRLNVSPEFYDFDYHQTIRSGLDGGVTVTGQRVRTESFDVDAGDHFLDLTLSMSSASYATLLGDGAGVSATGSLLWGIGFNPSDITLTSSALGIDYMSVVPEPAHASTLAGAVVLGLLLMRRRRR
jgi:MYXO-CTERM domain-containing protein